eukprot:scaffold134_cov61-Phaeocystis_antarctica.AAC.7
MTSVWPRLAAIRSEVVPYTLPAAFTSAPLASSRCATSMCPALLAWQRPVAARSGEPPSVSCASAVALAARRSSTTSPRPAFAAIHSAEIPVCDRCCTWEPWEPGVGGRRYGRGEEVWKGVAAMVQGATRHTPAGLGWLGRRLVGGAEPGMSWLGLGLGRGCLVRRCLRSRVEQDGDHSDVALVCSPLQRRHSVVHRGVDLGARGEQQLERLGVAAVRSHDEGRGAVVAA